MPRAKKHCGIRGCTVLVTHAQNHCADHQHGFVNGGTTRTTDPRHRAWRAAVLKRDNYICQLRVRNLCMWLANEADHVRAIAEGGDRFDTRNGMAICAPCHRYKSSREGHRAQGHRVFP